MFDPSLANRTKPNTSKPIDQSDAVLMWAKENSDSFDFADISSMMEPDEFQQYKESLAKDTAAFFKALMD